PPFPFFFLFYFLPILQTIPNLAHGVEVYINGHKIVVSAGVETTISARSDIQIWRWGHEGGKG
ncbi:hypothetical protein VN97_g10488, partial [Penicillium thymicola]